MYSAHQNHDAEPKAVAEMAAQAVARQLARLERMSEVGMALIEQIAAAPDTSPAPTPEQRALAFTRLARAMRQIIVLEQEVLGLRCTNPRLSGIPNEQRFNDARRLMGESAANQNDADAERSDARDTNDLREPDDLDDYDDNDGSDDPLREIIQAIQDAGAASAESTPPVAPTSHPIVNSTQPHAPVRRRALTRERGPPRG